MRRKSRAKRFFEARNLLYNTLYKYVADSAAQSYIYITCIFKYLMKEIFDIESVICDRTKCMRF